jgi:hypothetical protein
MSYNASVDIKEENLHVEDGFNLHHVDVKDAAADGHVATDEKGHTLVDIDPIASARLAWKVCTLSPDSFPYPLPLFGPPTDSFGTPRRPNLQFDLRIVPVVSMLYLWCFIDRANVGENSFTVNLSPVELHSS